MFLRSRVFVLAVVLGLAISGCGKSSGGKPHFANSLTPDVAGDGRTNNPETPVVTEKQDPPEVAIGQRLFRETRFAQFYFAQAQGRANQPLASGDPAIEMLPTLGQPIRNPYAGKGINCASCHLIGEVKDVQGGASRGYNDFARRSPIPDRGDGRTTTLRNSPAFVNATLSLEKDYQGRALYMHFDGEFATAEDLVKGGFTGRNFGWLADEAPKAVAHIAHIIKSDDGQDQLALDFGGAYAKVLKGTDPSIPEKFKLPAPYRIDVLRATDAQIFDSVAKLVAAYLKSLIYSRDEVTSEFNGSPYDAFLLKNALPRKPVAGESDLNYSRRLLSTLDHLPTDKIRFVLPNEGKLVLHSGQPFAFGARELEGLKTFLREPSPVGLPARAAHAGNCVACHAAPAFTDFSFHNTGASQEEYDSVHGAGKFAEIAVPNFAERLRGMETYLGPSPDHPNAKGQFASIPVLNQPGYTDLGVWNVFGNPSIMRPQAEIRKMLCVAVAKSKGPTAPCDNNSALAAAVGAFKTSGLRDLGHSAPYLHTGRKDTLEDVLSFYVDFSAMARQGKVRSSDPEIARIGLTGEDIASVSAFLHTLNEDYH